MTCCTKAAQKIMPPILCWPTTSEADVCGMTVEVEPYGQHSILCCCRVTDGRRGAVWLNGICHGSVGEAKVWHWIPPCGKKLHLLTSINACWMFMKTKQRCEHSEAGGGAFQQWWQWQWVISSAADLEECSMQALVHHWWKCIANGGDCWKIVFCSWEFALSNSVVVLFVSVVFSMEINKRHYFWSKQIFV